MNNDSKAIKIYHNFGKNLGVVLSHVISMLDPEIITIGGGLSNAYDCYKESMFDEIKKHTPSYNINSIEILPSLLKERSTMIGACLLVKNIKNI